MATNNLLEAPVDHGPAQYGSLHDESNNVVKDPDDESCLKGCWARYFPVGFLVHLKSMLLMSWPLIVSLVSQFMLPCVALMFCGRLGKLELASVALANSVINVSGLSICLGLSAACDILFAQISGSDKKILAGVVLQRSIIIMTLAILPMVALHINAQRILTFLGQQARVSVLVGEYLLIFIPALLLFPTFTALSKYLQNQKIVYPTLICSTFANIFNVSLHALLITGFHWNFTGSAIAQTISFIVMTLLTAAYVWSGHGPKETWGGWSRACLLEWGQFANLAFFGMLLTCISYWSFALGLFVAGLKGIAATGAMSVTIMLEGVISMVSYGISQSAGINIGVYLGEGHPQHAKTVARVAVTFASLLGIVVAIALVLLRGYIPLAFTNVRVVIDLVRQDMPFLAMFIFGDVVNGVYAGIFRGIGRQFIGAAFVACGYIIGTCIGIPLLLTIPNSIMGFWIGMKVGIAVVCALSATFMFRRSFEEEAKLARERVVAVVQGRDESIKSNNITGSDLSNLSDEEFANLNALDDLCDRSLIWRRVLVVSLCFGVLIAGVIVRLVFPPVQVECLSLLSEQIMCNVTSMTN